MVAKKKMGPTRRVVRPRGTPVPLPQRTPRRVPGQPTPVPMPKRVPNLSLPPDQRAKAKQAPAGPKKSGNSKPRRATPLETKRIGGVISIPKRPKRIVY